MTAQVFISCGQRGIEREAAIAVAKVFEIYGMRPYVATVAQSIQDVNSGIVAKLKRSDYYVFIDFRREPLPTAAADGSVQHRGSLFTHQELAIAYALGFEHVLFLSQRGTVLEGMSSFIASNAAPFDDVAELPSLVEKAIQSRGWTSGYSRNLVVENLAISSDQVMLRYEDLEGRFLYVDIHNRRPDVGAVGTVARLAAIVKNGARRPSPVRSHLKVAGHLKGYDQIIWPLSHGSVDLLCLGIREPASVYLNTALDLYPRAPIITSPGRYILEYEVFAQDFPVTTFAVQLDLTSFAFSSSAHLLNTD